MVRSDPLGRATIMLPFLQVNVIQPDIANLGSTETVLIGENDHGHSLAPVALAALSTASTSAGSIDPGD